MFFCAHFFVQPFHCLCCFWGLCCCVTYFKRVWTFHCRFSFSLSTATSVMPVVLLVIYCYYYFININSTNNNAEIVQLNLFLHHCSHEISHKSMHCNFFFFCSFPVVINALWLSYSPWGSAHASLDFVCNQFPDPVVIIYTLHPFSSSLPVTSGTVTWSWAYPFSHLAQCWWE